VALYSVASATVCGCFWANENPARVKSPTPKTAKRKAIFFEGGMFDSFLLIFKEKFTTGKFIAIVLIRQPQG
jgi:hypothetical protein